MKRLLFIVLSLFFFSCNFKSSAYYNSEAEKLEAQGRYAEAISLLDKAIEKDPKNIYALINRGVDKSILEDYKGAIEDYSRVIELDPDNALAFLNRGKNKNRLEDYEGAIEDYDKAIATKGGEYFYINKVENSFIDDGFEFDVAMEEIRYERGLSRFALDSLRTAFEDFSFCIEKEYEKAASLYFKGAINLEFGMNEEACADLTEARKLGDPDARALIKEYCQK